MIKKRHLEQRVINLREFEREIEHPHKFFQVHYKDEDGYKNVKEYRDKDNVKRIIHNDFNHDIKILVMGIVDDE